MEDQERLEVEQQERKEENLEKEEKKHDRKQEAKEAANCGMYSRWRRAIASNAFMIGISAEQMAYPAETLVPHQRTRAF